ncbi:MAG TPA: glycosyltransferase family 2 protein [bacterium]|nr:glycosyltransferase family 2 protein [bacterium]
MLDNGRMLLKRPKGKIDDIYIVIPVHNRKKLTKQCLRCLYDQTYKEFKIVIFDDGSTDGTFEMIKEKYPEIILLRGDGNYWWSKSVNEGIKYALKRNAQYILLLNDDVVLPGDYVESFVNVARHKPDIIMGSPNYDLNTGKLTFAGEHKDWILATAKRNIDLFNRRTLERKVLVGSDYLPGRGLWIPAKVFKKIGLFDGKRFPQAAADYDLTIRAKRARFSVCCNMLAKVYFNLDDTGPNKFKRFGRLKNLWEYLASIKSVGNLQIRWRFGIKNCPRDLLVSYLILDTLRIIGGYVKRCFKSLF